MLTLPPSTGTEWTAPTLTEFNARDAGSVPASLVRDTRPIRADVGTAAFEKTSGYDMGAAPPLLSSSNAKWHCYFWNEVQRETTGFPPAPYTSHAFVAPDELLEAIAALLSSSNAKWHYYFWNEVQRETTGFPPAPYTSHAFVVPDDLSEAIADIDIVDEAREEGFPSPPDDLSEAIDDIDNIVDEACEEGFPSPPDDVISTARRLLKSLHELRPKRFEVYPTPEGEIAIVAPGGPKRSVMALCDPKGEVLCMVNLNGNHRRARYSDANGLPDGFFREALADLEGG